MSVDFRWAPEPADWRASLRTMVPMFRWAPWFALALGAMSVVLLFLDMTAAGIFGLVFAVIIGFMEPVAVWWRFSSNDLVSQTVVGSADEYSFRMAVGGAIREEIDWAELPSWTETRTGFVLSTLDEGAVALSVPHRAFSGTDDQQRFRELLERHIGPSRS